MAWKPFITNLLGLAGTPESGGLLQSYVKSTTTPLPLYSDAGITPLTNPVVADSLGQITAYFNDTLAYTWHAKTADGSVTLWSADVVSGVLTLTFVNEDALFFNAEWVPTLQTTPFWRIVKAFGAKGDGTTDDSSAVHAARDAAGVGGVVYFPAPGTYIVDNLTATIDRQTWIVERGAVLKLKAAVTHNILVVDADYFTFIGTMDGNRANAPSGGMVSIAANSIAPSFHFHDAYASSSYAVYAPDVPNLKVSGKIRDCTTIAVFNLINARTSDMPGPDLTDLEIDMSNEPTSYNQPGIVVRGSATYNIVDSKVDAKVRMADDPDSSGQIAVEMWNVRRFRCDVQARGGSMAVSFANAKNGAGIIEARAFAFYGLEYGGEGCDDLDFSGVLDGRDESGANRCLYPVAYQGATGTNTHCWFRGRVLGATSSQSIFFGNGSDCGFYGDIGCGASNYALFSDGRNGFKLDASIDGETGGDYIAYLLNSTGGMHFTGKAKALDNGGVSIGANTAITVDNISVSFAYDDAGGGGFNQSLSGGAVLGEKVSAMGCTGQFIGGSSFRGQILNLKRAIYDIEGVGSPEASVAAGVGSIYRRADGSDGATLYIKSSGTGNTGWDAVPYYEEGTFNATITFETPGNLSVSYANQLCTYTRRGNRVEVGVNLVFTPTFTTASGALRIAGMPFTIANDQDTAGTIRDITSQFTWPASRTQLVVYPNSATSYLTIQAIGSAQNPSDITASNMTSGVAHTLRLSVSYRI